MVDGGGVTAGGGVAVGGGGDGPMGLDKRRFLGGGGATPPAGGGRNVGAGGAPNPFSNFGQFAGDSMGTPGEWAKHDGDGFSVEFPGTPETKEIGANGLAITITAVGGKTHPVTGVMMIQLPAAIAQLPAKQTLDMMMSQAKAQLGGAIPRDVTVSGHPGKELEVTQKGITVTMRMVLAHDRLYMFLAGGDARGGRQSMPRDQITRFFNSASISYKGSGGNVAGGSGGNVAIGGPGGGGSSPDAGLSEGGGFSPPPGPGGGMGIPRPAFGGGGPGGLGRPPAGIGTPRFGGGGPGGFGRPPMGGIGTPGLGDDSPQPPAGGLGQPPGFGGGLAKPGIGGGRPAGFPQPPGFGGGLGQPGAGGFGGTGDTNPPPFGALTDGNRKANVEPFFTGAFDPAKKEFFTFSARENGRSIATRLNRFDVSKDFAPAGSFKVPNFVTRAVIDPAKGLLYAATVSRATVSALGHQMLDQSVGVGDVQIFDLNQIREGKVKDGGDLKPLASIVLAREIRGLELTQDGQTLVVLLSTGGKSPKSFLTAYDTESRKVLIPQKELNEPAWDSCKSPDGKHLIVIDKVDPGKASMARLYDLASLTMVKTVSLQGGGLDVAATSGGQYAAAVVVNGSSKVVLATDKDLRDFDTGAGWKAAAKPGYVEYSPDGKLLFVSGHPGASGSYPRQGQQQTSAGLDVYDVTDADSASGLKKKASIRTAGGQMVGGHFVMSPGGEYLVFHTGAVVETANVGGNNGEGAVGAGAQPGLGAPGFGAPGAGIGGAGAAGAGVGGADVGGAGAAGVPAGGMLPLPGNPTPATGAPPGPPGPGGISPRPGGAGGQPGYGGGGMSPRPGGLPPNPSVPGGVGGQPGYGGGGMSPRPGGPGAPGAPGGAPGYGGGGMSPKPGGGM
jgi:hypothetical protein